MRGCKTAGFPPRKDRMHALPPNDNDRTPVTPPRRRFYAVTDNGDWMEMTPQRRGPLGADGVSFLAVDEDDDAEFFALAEEGEGILLGRDHRWRSAGDEPGERTARRRVTVG